MPNIWDSDEYGGFEVTAVVLDVYTKPRELTVERENRMQRIQKEYVHIELRPVGQQKPLEYPYTYPVTTRKPSKMSHLVEALDVLEIPTKGRPDNLKGEIFTFQQKIFEDLKFQGASDNACRVHIPVRKFESEEEALSFLQGEAIEGTSDSMLEEEAMIVGPIEEVEAPVAPKLTELEESVAKIALQQGTKSKLLGVVISDKSFGDVLSNIWNSEIQKKCEVAGLLKIEERDGEEYYT